MLEITESYANCDSPEDNLTCRICLEYYSEKHDPFCECRGHLMNVHQKCMLEWVNRTQKFKDERQNVFIKCDLCRTPIYLELSTTCHLRSLEESCQSKQLSHCELIFLLSTAFICLLIMGVCLKVLLDSQGANLILTVVTVVAGFIGTISLCIIFVRFFVQCGESISRIRPLSEMIPLMSIANSFSVQNL